MEDGADATTAAAAAAASGAERRVTYRGVELAGLGVWKTASGSWRGRLCTKACWPGKGGGGKRKGGGWIGWRPHVRGEDCSGPLGFFINRGKPWRYVYTFVAAIKKSLLLPMRLYESEGQNPFRRPFRKEKAVLFASF